MQDEYLTGELTVFFGIDQVYLLHRVNGRLSEMELDEGDYIEVKDGDGYKLITVKDALNTIVTKKSDKHNQWDLYGSFYEGSKVRVKINHKTTNQIESRHKKYAIRKLFKAVEDGFITREDAMETLLRWETDIEED